MEGGVVIEGARNCIPNSRPAGEHEEAWRRVSQDLSWMHSCNHMWHLISEKLTELKETRDHNAGKIVVRGAAAPADRGPGFDGYFPAPAVGMGVEAMARGMYFGAPPAAPPLAPLPGPPPVSQNFQPLGRMEDRRTDESRRTGRDQFTIQLQPRRPEELTDVAGARILKAKEAYRTRLPAPPQAKYRLPEPRIDAVRKDLRRDDGGAKGECRWWEMEVEESKGLAAGRREDRTGLAEDRRTMGEVTVRQGMVKEEKTEEPMAQARAQVGEKRKRDADTERNQVPEKQSRRSDGEVPTAPKDTSENEKLQLVLFRTEGGRAVHVGEKAERKSDPVRVVEAAHDQEATKSSANGGAETVSPLRLEKKPKPAVMDEANSEPRVVMCNRKDMPASSAGDPLPVKRKRRMDEEMEDGKPAKRLGTGHTFIREVHQQPPVPAQDTTKPKPTIAENTINGSKAKAAPAPSATHQAHKAKAAPAPSATHQAHKAKATATVKVMPVKTKPHVIQITSIDDINTKKEKRDPREPELEFKCGCTSKELGDRVGHLKVYKSGEIVIFCECKPGCPEAGKPLSPSGFERHAGRGAAKKWKHTIWLVVGNEKVPLYKVEAMEPYVEKNKGRKNLVKT